MDFDTLKPADIGALVAVACSLVVGLAAIPTLPGSVAVQWAADGSPTTVLPLLPGILLTPAFALLAFAYLRGGVFLASRAPELGATAGFAVVAGVSYLQVVLVALNLGVAVNPLVAVAPAIALVLAATYVERSRTVASA